MFKRFLKFAVIVSVLLVSSTNIFAQNPVDEIIINNIEAVSQESGEVIVTAYISVLDENKDPKRRLTGANIEVREGGVLIPPEDITTVELTSVPMSLIIVIDSTQSMAVPRGNGVPFDVVKEELIGLIDGHLNVDDRLAFFDFNDTVTLNQEFTVDHNAAINNGIVVLSVAQNDTACLYEALLKAVDKSTEVAQGRKAILVITDGVGAGCGGSTANGVVNKATQTAISVPIFTLGFGEADTQDLASIARQTNGVSYYVEDIADLTGRFHLIGQLFSNQYEIRFPAQSPGSEKSINIVVNEGGVEVQHSRVVMIPPPLKPTPTPIRDFNIEIEAESIDETTLEILVTIPEGITVQRTELIVDGEVAQRKTEAPFDRFILDSTELQPGPHNFRVDAVDENNRVASSDQGKFSTSSPATATRQVAETTASDSGGNPFLIVIGAVAGLLAFIFIVLVFFVVRSRRKKNTEALPEPISAETDVFITEDAGDFYDDPDKTMDEFDPDATMFDAPAGVAIPLARLVVIDGKEFVAKPEYDLGSMKITIGRDASNVTNDIDIQEKGVSRKHAQITLRGQNFYIQDVGSSFGTLVDEQEIVRYQDVILQNNSKISIGPRAKFQFEVINMPELDESDDKATKIDPDRTIDEDDETVYNVPSPNA